jgi:hypothetical protein
MSKYQYKPDFVLETKAFEAELKFKLRGNAFRRIREIAKSDY